MEKDNIITKFSDFEKNKENPFLKQAIEEINQNIVRKDASTIKENSRKTLPATSSHGENFEQNRFIKQMKAEEKEFVKFYSYNFKAFYGLSKKAIRIFGYILIKIVPDKDKFYFLISECIQHTGYKSKKTIYNGLADLLQANIIARGSSDTVYFINPFIVFKGNRIICLQKHSYSKDRHNGRISGTKTD